MDQSFNNNKLDFKEKLTSFVKMNKIKIFFTLIVLIISIILIATFSNYKIKANKRIAEKFVQADIYLTNDNYTNAIKNFEEIILSKNKFYSILALNKILEKNLITDKNKIIEYFKILENLKYKNETLDLIKFKKALYMIKAGDEKTGNLILNDLIKKNSNLKKLAKEFIEK